MALKDLFAEARREVAVMKSSMEESIADTKSSSGRAPQKRVAVANLTDQQHAEYDRVAALIGYAPSGLEADKMRRFLAETGIGVYELEAVSRYLDGIYGPVQPGYGSMGQRASWVWVPLRSADSARSWAQGGNWERVQGWHMWDNGEIGKQLAPYGKPVPLPVLLTVERVLERFPDAKFFVSDEYTAPPALDPFLAVEYGGALFVIERWNEPSFRG